MPRRSTKATVDSQEGDDSPSTGYEVFDRVAILKSIGVQSKFSSFEELVEATQKVISEMFLNQAAICLKIQTDYMARKRPLLIMDEFRILNILTDLMREVNAYDYGVDTNRAWEFLERQGYKITDENEDSHSENKQ